MSETPAAMAAYYTLHTTDGQQAVVPVPPGQDRWLIAVRYVNAYCRSDVFLADLTPATPQEIAAFQAEHPHASFGWLADDP
ncbi:MAG: hypothetical protein MUC51_17965 [Anaerolineae bacterium]|nr:hypothetical protein [Anaerolineae bacterium]